MDNYTAIMEMSREQLEAFLDNVYCTGLNNGMYASQQSEETAYEILGVNPFDKAWLDDTAEPATLCQESEDGDEYLLNAFTQAVLRNAGINDSQVVSKSEDKNTTAIADEQKK